MPYWGLWFFRGLCRSFIGFLGVGMYEYFSVYIPALPAYRSQCFRKWHPCRCWNFCCSEDQPAPLRQGNQSKAPYHGNTASICDEMIINRVRIPAFRSLDPVVFLRCFYMVLTILPKILQNTPLRNVYQDVLLACTYDIQDMYCAITVRIIGV